MGQKIFYEFGPFRIDCALGRLERGGAPVGLSPKAFDLLVLLARNTDRVMAKAELIQALWPDTFVDEANLTQHIYTLRKVLGDQSGGQPYIDTLPRRGYRLAAAVQTVISDSAEPDVQQAIPPLAQGERKHVTVVHCDISNAAAVIERIGPAAMHTITRHLLELAEAEIGRYEGVISERRTGGFAALFGASVVHEDDACRAVLAAAAIQQGFLKFETSADDPIDLQFGVGTGPLVVTHEAGDRRLTHSAVGGAAKVARVLQQLAEAQWILIDDATRRRIQGRVETVEAGIQVAGTVAYKVVGPVTAGMTRAAPLRRTLVPFVGRRHELGLLLDLAAQARAGQGHVISIVGDPGLGKSRLLHEFSRSLAAPITVLESRCLSYGSFAPYLPVLALVRTLCGVADSEPPEMIEQAVGRVVDDLGLPPDAGVSLVRLIADADQTGTFERLSPEAIKSRTFDALRMLFLGASIRTPLVIIVEDIHWIDRTSEEFLTTVTERVGAARLMLIATYRCGHRVPWSDCPRLTQITLTPLAADESSQIVAYLAGERPLADRVAAAILEKAEGNPFFLEELGQAVVEGGGESVRIPDTVQGVIMARIDRLPAAAKQLLQRASVLGREVPQRLLTRLWQGGGLDAALRELCRLEFLHERPGPEDATLVFKHALTQDVAYDSLLARNRAELHLRAAEALESAYGMRDDLAATFAYHYARTDRIEDAVSWLTRAADRAARVYANAEAILHLDLAARKLQRMGEGPERDRHMLEVALRHAQSLYFLGRFRDSVDVLLPHEGRLRRLNDLELSAAYSFWLAHMYSRLGDQRRAVSCAHRAIAAATEVGDDATLGKAHGLLALEGHWSGDTALGVSHGRNAVALLERRADQRWWLGMAHFYLAMNHLLAGAFESALTEVGRADAIGREIGDPRLQTYAAFTAAWVEASRGECAEAIAQSRRSLEQAPDRVSRAYASMFSGLALLEDGAHEQARDLLEPIVAELEGFSFPQWHGLAMTLLADALRLAGRLDEAATIVERGRQVVMSAGYAYGVGCSWRVLGRIARDRGQAEQGLTHLLQALEVFLRIGAAFEAARTRLEISAASATVGGARARAELAAALCTFQTLETPVYVDRARQLAETLGLQLA